MQKVVLYLILIFLKGSMNTIEQIQHDFNVYLQKAFGTDITNPFTINTDPHKEQFGDLNSNAAMVLAKQIGRNPRDIAQEIIKNFQHTYLEKLEIAGAGFINGWLTKEALHQLINDAFTQKSAFFKTDHTRQERHYSLEFVSANPTGPLHLGHGRGGIIGDVLGNILTFLGHQVTKEFYINDAGSQIQKLGMSLKIRCQQAAGLDAVLPEDAYHGEYLVRLAHHCVGEYRDFIEDLWQKPDRFFEQFAMEHLLNSIRGTLEQYGIYFDVWFSEKTLHSSGAIDRALELLNKRGYLFEQDGALWFKSTAFGDDKDRVVRKATGELTYVAADVAYMLNKIERGANFLIMVLGHDHHSYVMRLDCVRRALGLEQVPLDVILYQLVKMKAGGALVQMSKRAGTMVTLDEVIEAVGTDVARFFYLHRKADAQLEFDLDLALKKTEENPVYYIQYAYVRINSILAKTTEHGNLQEITASDSIHSGADEALLIKKIASLKELLETISHNYQTHLLTYYVIELADLFHRYYAHHRVIDPENPAQSRARILLLITLKDTFATIFDLLGISKPERM